MAGVRDQAAYMRDYRARKRLGRPPKSRDEDPTPVLEPDLTHEACDRRIAELEEDRDRLRAMLLERGISPERVHAMNDLDDLL